MVKSSTAIRRPMSWQGRTARKRLCDDRPGLLAQWEMRKNIHNWYRYKGLKTVYNTHGPGGRGAWAQAQAFVPLASSYYF